MAGAAVPSGEPASTRTGSLRYFCAISRCPLRQCRGEERHLPVRGRRGEDAFHVRRKALVEHLVSFIQHANLEAIQPQVALAQMVEHTSRRANRDLRASIQRRLLWTKRAPANQLRDAQPASAVQRLDDASDLRRQFTCRYEHERLQLAHSRVHTLHKWQPEGNGLARSRA